MSDRLPAVFCIGCRRVDAPQLCPQGCDEQAIDLVFGDAQDAALTELSDNLRHVAVSRTLLHRTISSAPGPELRAEARSVLSQINASAGHPGSADEAVRLTAGHCRVCGWIEAPQPCLGVCIFRAVQMVPAADYDAVRDAGAAARHQLDELTGVIRQLAWVTPRAGEGERTRRALVSRARKALASAG